MLLAIAALGEATNKAQEERGQTVADSASRTQTNLKVGGLSVLQCEQDTNLEKAALATGMLPQTVSLFPAGPFGNINHTVLKQCPDI